MTDIQSQRVTDEPNENTIFMVWNFKDGMDVAPVFKRLCALVGNLTNSATNRFPQQKASVVLGMATLGFAQAAAARISRVRPD